MTSLLIARTAVSSSARPLMRGSGGPTVASRVSLSSSSSSSSSSLTTTSTTTTNTLKSQRNSTKFVGGIRRYNSTSSSNQKQRKSTLAQGGFQQQSQQTMTSGSILNTTQGAIRKKSCFQKRLRKVNRILNKPRPLPIPRWISPTYSTTTISEIFGHSSFILVAISYAEDDFLQLRLLAIAGSSVMLVFAYFHPHGRVLWLPFKWNVLFIAINSYRVAKVYLDRYFAERLSPLMLHLYETHFNYMDKVDFAKLMRLGHVETFKTDDPLTEQGHDNKYVRLILRGEIRVERDGVITYVMHEGNFISESGLHAGILLRDNINSCASIIANSADVVTLRWDRTELMQLLEIDKNIRNSLKAVMSWDIVSKLKSQRLLLARGKISNAEEWSRIRREQTVHRYKAILGNMLAHPQYLNSLKNELKIYRDIHHIDDELHEECLKEMGWTIEEFEHGNKEDWSIDEDKLEKKDRQLRETLKGYAQKVKLRIFG